MAKKEEKFDYKTAAVAELENRLDKTKQDLFKLRFRAAAAPLTNTMQIRKLRREVARLTTFINLQNTSGQKKNLDSKNVKEKTSK